MLTQAWAESEYSVDVRPGLRFHRGCDVSGTCQSLMLTTGGPEHVFVRLEDRLPLAQRAAIRNLLPSPHGDLETRL
eukprot:1363375-Alexandrium_andersonii.AAC.1